MSRSQILAQRMRAPMSSPQSPQRRGNACSEAMMSQLEAMR